MWTSTTGTIQARGPCEPRCGDGIDHPQAGQARARASRVSPAPGRENPGRRRPQAALNAAEGKPAQLNRHGPDDRSVATRILVPFDHHDRGTRRVSSQKRSASVRKLRVAVDIGGTFTDLVAYDEDGQELITVKTPSTPPTFIEGVMNALEKAADRAWRDRHLQARLDDLDERDHRAPRGGDRDGDHQGLQGRARRGPRQPPGPLQLQLGPLPAAGAPPPHPGGARAHGLRGDGDRGAERGRRPRCRPQVQAQGHRVDRGRLHQFLHAARSRAADARRSCSRSSERTPSSPPPPRSSPRSASSSAPPRSRPTPT